MSAIKVSKISKKTPTLNFKEFIKKLPSYEVERLLLVNKTPIATIKRAGDKWEIKNSDIYYDIKIYFLKSRISILVLSTTW